MQCDQKKFSTIVSSSEIDPVVKTHVLGKSIQVACGFRDIEIVRFLEKNGVSIAKLHVISNDGVLEESTSIVFALNHFYGYKRFDQELVDFLLKKGADFNDKHDGVTAYFSVISSIPEEFSIKMLESITDINEVQHERRIYSFDTCPDIVRIKDSSYLTRAIVSGRFKLAKAMIKCGAEIEEDQISLWLAKTIKSYNNFEFVQYLFEKEYITSLKKLEGSEHLLVQALLHKNDKMFGLLVQKGADVNFKSEVHGGDIWSLASRRYEIAKIIVASGKLDLTGRDKHEVEKYNQIKEKMAFEEKVLADVEAVKAAHAGINSATIGLSFIPKKQVDAMLKYYLKGYKTKFAEEIKSGDTKFFDDLAGQVVKSLNEYIKFSWNQLHGVAKEFGIEVSLDNSEESATYTLPKDVIGLIGEYVVFNYTQEIVD